MRSKPRRKIAAALPFFIGDLTMPVTLRIGSNRGVFIIKLGMPADKL
jgi:hypothetical protein